MKIYVIEKNNVVEREGFEIKLIDDKPFFVGHNAEYRVGLDAFSDHGKAVDRLVKMLTSKIKSHQNQAEKLSVRLKEVMNER